MNEIKEETSAGAILTIPSFECDFHVPPPERVYYPIFAFIRKWWYRAKHHFYILLTKPNPKYIEYMNKRNSERGEIKIYGK